ncbi:MAG: hypothetical protein ACI3YH_08860 [Eubacteriales bacterium]
MNAYPSYDMVFVTVQMYGSVADETKFDHIIYQEFDSWNSDRDPYVHVRRKVKYADIDASNDLQLANDHMVTWIEVTVPYEPEVVDE